MPIERAPRNPVPRNWVAPGTRPYRVQDGDSWESVARANGVGVWELIESNFRTRNPAEVNWYLHHYVGCTQPTRDGRNWMFSSSADPGRIHIPQSSRIRLSVPMRAQGRNPICWMACVAMIASYKGRQSLGIGQFSGGFDPADSSIPNPTQGWDDQYRRLAGFGFVSGNPFPDRSPDSGYIAELLRRHGPWMLTHFASDLLPGNFPPDATHAVVITGIDTSTGQVWYNNPWGMVDEVTTVDRILATMEHLLSLGIHAVAYLP